MNRSNSTIRKFDELSITWNTIDSVRQATWADGDPEWHVFHLQWRDDAVPELAAYHDQQLVEVEFVEWTDANRPKSSGPAADVSFIFADGEVIVWNALDENGLDLGPRKPHWRAKTRRW